jgi:peptide/nickel transport system substrate-binding protein/oligopeptide transport system substrate-binding protein
MKKKVISLVLIAAMAFGLAACGDATTTENSTSAGGTATATSGEKELRVQVGPNPETIDPALNSAVDGGNIIIHTFETLLTTDEDGQIQAGQAETWEVSDDGLTWTFHLRDGLKWSDGSDLTANDFVYSWKRVCDPEVAAPYADTVLSMVKGFDEAAAGDLDALAVTATDDTTLVVELSSPCTYFDSLAAFATLSPVQQATVEANGDSWAVEADTYITNGPFKIDEWVPSSHITLVKNENYWNADAIKLDKLTFLLIEDSNAAYSAYQTGDALMIKDVPTEEIPSLEGQDDFYVDPIIGTYYINLNLDLEQFQDVKVRKALSLAIDREYVADTIMQGTYTAAGNFMGPGWLDTDGSTFMDNANNGEAYIDTTDYDANLEEAKSLLAEAGYADGAGFPTITYTTNDAGYHKALAEYLQQAWGELGLDVKVEILGWSSFTPARRSGDYEVARNGWVGDYTDPSNMLDLLYSTNGNNDGNYNSEEYDAQMTIARTTTDDAERSAALHAAEDILMEDVAVIPIAYYNDFYLMSNKITGAWHSATGYWYFMYADITE